MSQTALHFRKVHVKADSKRPYDTEILGVSATGEERSLAVESASVSIGTDGIPRIGLTLASGECDIVGDLVTLTEYRLALDLLNQAAVRLKLLQTVYEDPGQDVYKWLLMDKTWRDQVKALLKQIQSFQEALHPE